MVGDFRVENKITGDKQFRAWNITSQKIEPREGEHDKALIVSGVANSGQADRWQEVMPEDCWKLDNFKLNPIMLYNHDHSKPIGRVLKLTPTDKGLEFVAEIGVGSDFGLTETQKEVRALIAQGVLNTLSVGFIAHDWAWEGKDGRDVLVYKSAELTEISVVTVPMDALATITGVSVKSLLGQENSKQQQGEGAMPLEYKDLRKLFDEAVKSINEGSDAKQEALLKEISKSEKALKEKSEAESKLEGLQADLEKLKSDLATSKETIKESEEYIAELEEAVKELVGVEDSDNKEKEGE
jgi:HK97 family phage prohead protease